jgi:hypothetical protein
VSFGQRGFRVFSWLFPKPPAPTEADLYFKRMDAALGYFRGQVLACTMSDKPGLPQYFNPPEGTDLKAAFREHLEGLWARWLPEATGPQFNGMAVVAAGLLTYGRLDMAAYILDHLPDHFVMEGFCNRTARYVVAVVLPLPAELCGWPQWIAGSPEAEAVQSWFAANRALLRWEPLSGKFVLRESEGTLAEP